MYCQDWETLHFCWGAGFSVNPTHLSPVLSLVKHQYQKKTAHGIFHAVETGVPPAHTSFL